MSNVNVKEKEKKIVKETIRQQVSLEDEEKSTEDATQPLRKQNPSAI